ncbi:MAG: DNA repair protein RecN [Ferruginibacter sp.]|nr:DNA repair protein RecN [Ferruginibacter sp.]
MLQKLHIQNYAIIDEIAIDFSGRLNIITGETGAGKSILMGALGLILGARAEANTLMNKEKKCVVEGSFLAKNNKQVKIFLLENELDPEEELVVRREIAVNGKSRAFINDTPVNLAQLKGLSSMLVDLHQQFDTLELGDHDFQRMVLDALAGNSELVQKFTEQYLAYISSKRKLDELREQQQTATAALDYNQYLYDELEEAGFSPNELEELEVENKLLSNAENIKQQLGSIYFELKESELPIVQQLKTLRNKLQALEPYHTAISDLNQRLVSAQVELQDIADELEGIDEAVQYSPERIQLVNDKIATGYKLFKKHGVNSTEELLTIKDALQAKLSDILNLGESIGQQEQLVAAKLASCEKLAVTISANRAKAAKPFTETVNGLLIQVGMPNARLKVQVEKQELGAHGIDNILFLFDANKTDRFEPLAKVASGGELSRIMLCIKSLVAKKLQLPTLIFDEIDTGISGEAAKQVGIIMQELAQAHQLISITHQPQIAARADAHYFVYKTIRDNKVATSIRVLNNDERITTIAQMLSGEKPTAAALENAREMVSN